MAKLGQLIDQSTYTAMLAVTVVPWHERPDQERMQAVNNHVMTNAKKVGQFVDKKGRMACKNEIPYGRKMMTDWVGSHAAALAQANPRMKEETCLKQSLYDVLRQFGYGRPFKAFATDYDRFAVR